jgi:hypothetical protein
MCSMKLNEFTFSLSFSWDHCHTAGSYSCAYDSIYTGLMWPRHKIQHLNWLSFMWVTECDKWLLSALSSPEQFIIRSAPCAFLQNSSFYVLRPVPSSGQTAVYTVQFRLYNLSLSLSLSLSVLHCSAFPWHLIFCHSSVSFLLTESDPDFYFPFSIAALHKHCSFSTAALNHSNFCVFNVCTNHHNWLLVKSTTSKISVITLLIYWLY